jgi:hypothetical protein
MKTFEYQNYFVHISDAQPSGMIYATARADDTDDVIRCAYMDYPMRDIVAKMRSNIRYRKTNQIVMKG